jgi:DNA-directed RNA polymerase subunit F
MFIQQILDVCQEQNKELPMYYVHSANPVGAENIRRFLENAKKYM